MPEREVGERTKGEGENNMSQKGCKPVVMIVRRRDGLLDVQEYRVFWGRMTVSHTVFTN